jgi:hypothetical protein
MTTCKSQNHKKKFYKAGIVEERRRAGELEPCVYTYIFDGNG